MGRVRSLRLVLGCVLAASVLAACGGSGGGSDASSDGGDQTTIPTLPGGGSNGGTFTTPKGSTSVGSKSGRVRVLNAWVKNGEPGPAIDLYDTYLPGDDDEPLIENLAFGELSDYVEPRGLGGSGNLTMYPHGSKTKGTKGSDGAGQSLSNAGFDKGTQRTLVIGTGTAYDDRTQTQPSFQEILETGKGDITVPDSWKSISGKGVLLGNVAGTGLDSNRQSYYLAVDGTCPKRVDPENSAGGSVESLANGNAVPFAVEPGSHELTVLSAPFDSGLSTCDLSAKVATTTVDVPEGRRVEVFVVSSTGKAADTKLVTAEVPE